MTHQLDLTPDLEARLQVLAAQRGTDTDAAVLQLVAEGLRDVSLEAAQTPTVGSLSAARAQSARLRALLAAPAEERAQVLAAEAEAYAAFCETPEGRAEWEEMQPWLNTPGPDTAALEAEDAAEVRAA